MLDRQLLAIVALPLLAQPAGADDDRFKYYGDAGGWHIAEFLEQPAEDLTTAALRRVEAKPIIDIGITCKIGQMRPVFSVFATYGDQRPLISSGLIKVVAEPGNTDVYKAHLSEQQINIPLSEEGELERFVSQFEHADRIRINTIGGSLRFPVSGIRLAARAVAIGCYKRQAQRLTANTK